MLNLEICDRRFLDLVDPDADLTLLSSQFQFTEGPIWDSTAQKLLFSDIADSKAWIWTEKGGFSVLPILFIKFCSPVRAVCSVPVLLLCSPTARRRMFLRHPSAIFSKRGNTAVFRKYCKKVRTG